MTSANDVVPKLRVVIHVIVSELKGHPHRLGLRIGENRRLRLFSVCCGSNLGGGGYL